MRQHLRRFSALNAPTAAAIALALVVLAGCEAIFTFSPVGFMQTPPDNMSADQLSGFGLDSLSGGDDEAMTLALDAINALIDAGDLTTEEVAELSLVGGSLAIELSGVGDVLASVLLEEIDLTDFTSIDNAITTLGVNLELLSSGGDLLVGAGAAGAELNSSQLALAAIGLIVDPVTGDFESGACGTIPPAETAFHQALWDSIGSETNPDGTPTVCPP